MSSVNQIDAADPRTNTPEIRLHLVLVLPRSGHLLGSAIPVHPEDVDRLVYDPDLITGRQPVLPEDRQHLPGSNVCRRQTNPSCRCVGVLHPGGKIATRF